MARPFAAGAASRDRSLPARSPLAFASAPLFFHGGTSTSACAPCAPRPRAFARDASSSLSPPCFPLSPSFIAKGMSSSVRHSPYFSGAVVGDQQRAVAEHEEAGGAAPDASARLIRHPADDEIVVAAGRMAVLEWNTNDFVAGAARAVPRAVQSDEGAAAIFRREHRAVVEGDADRGRVRLDAQRR